MNQKLPNIPNISNIPNDQTGIVTENIGHGDMPQSEDKIGSGTDKIPMSVPKTQETPKRNFLDTICPYCGSEKNVKRGTRQKKLEKVQLYLCNDCGRTFTPGSVKGKHYPMSVILDAISLYYIGFSLEQAAKLAGEIAADNKSRPASEVAGSSDSSSRSRSFSDVASNDQEGQGDMPQSADNIGSGTLSNWIKQYEPLCAFSRMREFAVKMLKPKDMISSATLAHRQLYRFRHHRAKTILIIREDFKHSRFWPLKDFLDLIPVECPHQYFQEGMRASEAPIMFSKTEMIVRGKNNFANKMAKFVLESVSAAKDRHDALQRFMLANDSVTVATEVPVYIRREDLAHMQTQLGFKLFKKNKNPKNPNIPKGTVLGENIGNGDNAKMSGNAGTGMNKELEEFKIDDLPKLITGHIDFIQIRNGQIHILDYKPNAAKERPIEQLTIYALALSRLTGLKVFNFKCAWFDEKDYFEFFPLHVVYKPDKKRKRRKIGTIEGTYALNDNPKRVENIRPASEVVGSSEARNQKGQK
ncbi:MAG: PD-(D/E)XK nuclease family protein [Candidatus Liptonbacteria bacterium]|nr:PD-(D/E)XK nuclease family protein [Candidatus Liptonbacteria bacterium]